MKRLGKWLGPHKAIEIVEEDGVRVLQIGGNAIQSAMRLDAPDRIELDYVRAMMAFLLFRPNPRDVLLVGLGGGSMARFIHQRMPKTRVSVVEIDPGVVTVARRYFHFPEEDARLEIVIGDGAQVVPRRPARYHGQLHARPVLLRGVPDRSWGHAGHRQHPAARRGDRHRDDSQRDAS